MYINDNQINSTSVSILIVNWNSGKLLDECLKMLMDQTVKPDQIIVLDNNSSDDVENTIASYKNVTLEKSNINLGFAAGNNLIIKKYVSDYVVLLNPDAFPEPEWLENLLNAAAANPNVAAFGSRQLVQANPEFLDGIGDSYHISGHVWRQRYGEKQRDIDLKQKEIFSPCAAAALYRREALLEVGAFDEDFFCYIEDVDLGFRLRLAGYKALYVPDAVIHHVGSASMGGYQNEFSIYHGHRNLVWAYIKNMPSLLFWLFLPVHILGNIYIIIRFIFIGKGNVILNAKWDAIKGIPLFWRKRKIIQNKRVASISEIWKVLDKRILPFR